MSNNIKQVYQCSDDTVFDNALDAQCHQNKLNQQNKILELVDVECYSRMTRNEVYDFIIENREALKELL